MNLLSINSSISKTLQVHQKTVQRIDKTLGGVLTEKHSMFARISPTILGISGSRVHLSKMLENKYEQINVVANIAKKIDYPSYLTRKYQLPEAFTTAFTLQQSTISAIETFNFRNQKIFNAIQSVYIPQTTYDLVSSVINSKFTYENLELFNVDFTGIDELDIDSIVGIAKNDLSAEKNHSEKLQEVNESQLMKIFEKYTEPKGNLSLKSVVAALFETYVLSEALKILNIIFSVIIALNNGAINAELKEEIGKRFDYASTYRENRKILTKYIKIYPTDQVAFLREETYLRKGLSKNAPVVSNTKISTKTVLTIIERRGNWIKVEIDTGESCGEIGWIQESMSIKFKKIK